MSHFIIISPCYNEENVIDIFLNELEKTLEQTANSYTIIIIDDCSTDSSLEKLKNYTTKSENISLKIITLKYNVGHQQAIRQGLIFAKKFDAKGYIVMDSDGEDSCQAIIDLVALDSFEIVFISRGKRSEELSFKIGYFFYKKLFKLICGNVINFGNFSMINQNVLTAISMQHFGHYSAFLSKLKYKKTYLKHDRKRRIAGKSKMKFSSLILHGLKSLIEYSEELLFFFIRILVLLIAIFIVLGIYLIYTKFITHTAIAGWTSTIGISIINSILITLGIIVLGLLIISQKEQNKPTDGIIVEL